MTFLSMLRAITVFVAAVFIGLIFNFWHDDGELGGIELFLAILVSGIIWIGFVILLILADNDARASEDYARARGYPTGPDPAESIDEVSLSASDDSATDDSATDDSASDDSASDDSASDDSATPPVSPEASPAITRSNAFRVADGAGVGNLVPLVGLIPGGELR